MDSLSANAFFSRVFDERLGSTHDKINRICACLDVVTTCIDSASPRPPSEEAKSKIASSDFLIALCSRKHKIDGKDEYLTSTAVREEIAIAKALNKKVVCFLEKGVSADGFSGSHCTYSYIENIEDLTPQDLFNVVAGVHRGKLAAVSSTADVFHATGVKNFYVSRLEAKYELKRTSIGLLWDYTIEKTLNFESEHTQPISSAAYCMQKHENCIFPPRYKIEIERNGRPVEVEQKIISEAGYLDIKSVLNPHPKKEDVVFLRERYQSPYLSPIYSKEGLDSVHIGLKMYSAFDGLCIVNRIQKLNMRFVFPKNFQVSDFSPVVATFSRSLDFVNESEVQRIQDHSFFQTEVFDKQFTARLSVDRPLYQYFYGLAWAPPSELMGHDPVADDIDQWIE